MYKHKHRHIMMMVAKSDNINVEDIDDIEITPEEQEFNRLTKALCDERNISFDKIKNARDLSSPPSSPVRPNRLYRTGRLSDASDKDIDFLFEESKVQTIVDLRSPTELKDDPTLQRDAVFQDFTSILWAERGRARDGCLIQLAHGESPVRSRLSVSGLFSSSRNTNSNTNTNTNIVDQEGKELLLKNDIDIDIDNDIDTVDNDCDSCADEGGIPTSALLSRPAARKERHFVSLMNEFKYVRGTLSKVRKRDLARTVLKSPGALLSQRVRDAVKEPFLDKINDGGLPMLNELLLRFGSPGIMYVLELCADRSRHPVIFHCTAGKDRTGMITAIILSFLGVPDEEIVQDYTLSANVYAQMNDHKAMVGALSQRSLNPKTFLGAPPQVMRDTLEAIREDYGSVEGYMTWIGFGPEKQEQLRKALTEE